MLHDLTAGLRRLESLLVLRDLFEKHVYLVELVLIRDVSFAFLFFLVVFVDCRALFFEGLHDHVHAVVRVLHDQSELLLLHAFFFVAVAPHQGNAVRVVKVPLDSLEGREREPPDEAAHVLQFVVGFKDEQNLGAV